MILDPSTSAYVQAVVRQLRSLNGERLLGVYLLGSGSMGGFDPRKSDVDVAAVTTGRLDLEQKREIVRRLSHPSLHCPVRKLELVVYEAEAVRGTSPSLQWELNLNTGSEVGVRASYDPSVEPEHWFLLDAAMARDHARTMFGPPPQSVFGEIDRDRVLRALLGSLRWHRANDLDGVQSILNACRAWCWLEDGRWSPKPAAAGWARARAKDPGVVDAAVAARGGDGNFHLDGEAVLRFVADVEGRVEPALRGS
ncbi:MAG: aminoglycoside adenylyltransferase domain-containing protein [Actinomycetota bacterium]